MRVIDIELPLVAVRFQPSVDMQVVVGVVIIGELPHMCIHIAVQLPLIDMSAGGQIQCGGA